MTRRRLALVLVAATFVIVVCVHGCLSAPRISASGAIAGHALSGPVDSVIARDYLEGRTLPATLAAERRRHLRASTVPSREALAELSQRYSPDVATLLFIEALSGSSDNQALRQRFEAEVEYVRRLGVTDAAPVVGEDFLVLFVPGWFYRTEGADNGADLAAERRLLDRLGVAHRLVAVDENGTVADNARIVADAIRRESPERRLMLVSASKGGPEVAAALGRELAPEETRSVVGWLSIGGVVRGTPFADRVLEPDLCWLARLQLGMKGFDLAGAKSMRSASARDSFEGLDLPPHVPIVAYVAAPLSGHVSARGAFGYGRMRDLGPNDGLGLLADELIEGATVLLAPGVDHFFEHDDRELWTAALFRVLVERFGAGR